MPTVQFANATRNIVARITSNAPPPPGYGYIDVTDAELAKITAIPEGRRIDTATVDDNGIITVTLLPAATARDASLAEMIAAWVQAEQTVTTATATYQTAVTAYNTAAATATSSIQGLPNSATKTALTNIGTALQRMADRDAALAQAVNQIDNVKLELLAELARAKTIRQVPV